VVNGRAIFCLTDHSMAGRVCQISTRGRCVFINCDGKHGAVQFAVRSAVQSPESERAARIHGKSGTNQIAYPLVQRRPPSTHQATHEIFRLEATFIAPARSRRVLFWRYVQQHTDNNPEFINHAFRTYWHQTAPAKQTRIEEARPT
jgi:hypothetical protein